MGNNISKTVISQCLEWLNIPDLFAISSLSQAKAACSLLPSICSSKLSCPIKRKDPDSIVRKSYR